MATCKRSGLFLFGVGIGTAAGLLLAPKSGKEIRQELFGGSGDVMFEPGTESGAPPAENMASEEELKARIEETSARLKAEIEAQQEEE
jgi:gas vesicle protein